LLLGHDLITDVLPALPPNWGGYLIARQPTDPNDCPVHAIAAFDLPEAAPGSADAKNERAQASLQDAVENALVTAWNVMAASSKAPTPMQAATVHSEARGDATLHWIDAIGPYRPAFAIVDDRLVLASDPETFDQFRAWTGDELLTENRVYQKLAEYYFPTANQFLLANTKQIRRLLRDRERHILARAEALPAGDSAQATAPRDRFERVDEFLGLVDAAFVTAQVEHGFVRLVFGGVVDPTPDPESAPEGR
jgi:hypothetical protein